MFNLKKLKLFIEINYVYIFHILVVSSLLLYQTYPLIFYKQDTLNEINEEFIYYRLNTYILFIAVFVMISYHLYKLML